MRCRGEERAGSPGGQYAVSWEPLHCCSPFWRLDSGLGAWSPGGDAVWDEVDAAPGFWFDSRLSALGFHHAGSFPCSSLFLAQRICSASLA